jgi:hypothetical protein
MAADDPKHDRPTLNISVVGAGISPEDIPIGDLGNILRSTASLLRAVADERELTAPEVALTKIAKGSAVYAFTTTDPTADHAFGPLVNLAHDAIKERGKGFSLPVRVALDRLYSSSARGPLQVSGTTRDRLLDAVTMAQPLPIVAPSLDAVTTLYGRLTGITSTRSGFSAMLKPRDGRARADLYTDVDVLAERAGKLFNQNVRVAAKYSVSSEGKRNSWELLSISPWESTSLLSVLDEIREDLASRGAAIDSERFERALFDKGDDLGDA